MKKLLITLLPILALAACNSGGGYHDQYNNNSQMTTKSVGSGSGASILTQISNFDQTRIGFAARFTGQSAQLQVAFSPYNVANDTHTASDCENAAAIYNATIAPIKAVSPQTTLDSVWNKDEYFNCNDGITKMVVQGINNATQSIYAAVYDFNNPDITYALIQKKQQNPNMDIQVIADQSNLTSTDSMIAVLKQNNIPVYISAAYSIMHNKFMVFDGKAVEYGSFNYSTTAAVEQANNAILIDNSNIAKTYTDRWNEIRQNESTSIYQVFQSKYTDTPYIPDGFIAVTPSEKTGVAATQIHTLNINNAQIDVVHELANVLNSNLTCPTDITTIGGICLPDYNYVSTDSQGKKQYNKNTAFYNLIDSAKTSIQIAVFAFSDSELLYRLKKAESRGVNVQVVADYNWNMTGDGLKYSIVQKLANAGIEVRTNANYEILHNKYMIVDGETVQTGSYNYTGSASTANAENYQIYYNQPELASLYQQDWQELFNEGKKVQPQS